MTTALVLVTVVTLLVSAMCSLFESTLYSTRVAVLEAARSKPATGRAAERFLAMKRNIASPTSAILILNTIANTAGAAVGGMLAAEAMGIHMLPIYSAILTLCILLFSEILPKTYGALYWQKLWLIVVWPLGGLETSLKPAVWLTRRFSDLFVGRNKAPPAATEDEIRAMIRIGARAGTLTRTELELLSAVFQFDEALCRQVMLPWAEVACFMSHWDRDTCVAELRRHRHTRYPLLDSDTQHVVGMIHATDLIAHEASNPFDLTAMARPIRTVPETMRLARLMREMQASRRQMAVVLDEYGNKVGLVTLENVLEQIVGSLQDEFDEDEPEIVNESETAVLARGLAPLRRLSERLGLDLPVRDDVDTLSGWVVSHLGRLPKVGDETRFGRWNFEVVEVMNNRAERVRITPLGPDESGESTGQQSEHDDAPASAQQS